MALPQEYPLDPDFASVVFMGGIIGRFIQPFAVIVTLGVLVSLFVALTLTPMLCSRYLRPVPEPRGPYRFFEIAFRGMEAGYGRLLRVALRWRWTVIVAPLAVVSTTGYFMGQLGKGFMPDEDESRFIVTLKTPLGSSIGYTRDRLRAIEEVLAGYPEIGGLFSTIGTGALGRVNQGEIFVRLLSPESRERKQSEVIAEIRERLAAISGVRAFASPVPVLSGQRGEPLQFVLKGPDLLRVASLAEKLR